MLPRPPDDRIQTLAQELALAYRFQRPAILLAVYRSELIRDDAGRELSAALRESGQNTRELILNEQDYDLPQILRESPPPVETVCLVRGLRLGGGVDGRNAYRALNFRREYLIEQRLRVVFWLTEQEAAALPFDAPDFWAFRHRVVEFLEDPQSEQVLRHLQEKGRRWEEQIVFPSALEEKIELREQLIQKLEEQDAAPDMRAALQDTLAELYYQSGALNQAEMLYRELQIYDELHSTPHRQAKTCTLLADIERQQDHLDEAEKLYYQAAELDPASSAPWYGLGMLHLDLGDGEVAITDFEQAIQRHPESASHHFGLGMAYRDLGRLEEATQAFQQSIRLDPLYAPPHVGLGNIFYDLHLLEKAALEFREADRLSPTLASPCDGLGRIAYSQQKYQLAVVWFQEAIRRNPHWATPHANLGMVYRSLDYSAQAIQEYKKANHLAPDNPFPFNGLGNLYADAKEWDRAIRAYRKAIRLDPGWAVPRQNLGASYRARGKYAEAATHYRKATSLDPFNLRNFISLAICYRMCGNARRWQREIDHLEPMIATEPLVIQAEYAATAGNLDQALELLEQVVYETPSQREEIARNENLLFLHTDPRYIELITLPSQPPAEAPSASAGT